MFQVAIPIVGLKEVKECIADFISKFGEGFMDSQNDLMDSMTLKTELGKTFYFDANHNDRGSFLRVSEVSHDCVNIYSNCNLGQGFERIPYVDHDPFIVALRVPQGSQ